MTSLRPGEPGRGSQREQACSRGPRDEQAEGTCGGGLEDAAHSIPSGSQSGKDTPLVPRHEGPGVTGMRNLRYHG